MIIVLKTKHLGHYKLQATKKTSCNTNDETSVYETLLR